MGVITSQHGKGSRKSQRTCPECKAEYTAGYKHTCRDTKCAFCRKEGDEFTWAISFGNSPLMGKEAVDYVCPDCILEGFRELEKLRALMVGLREAILLPLKDASKCIDPGFYQR